MLYIATVNVLYIAVVNSTVRTATDSLVHEKCRNPNRGSQVQCGHNAAARLNLDTTRQPCMQAQSGQNDEPQNFDLTLEVEWSQQVLWLRRPPNFVARNADTNPTALYTTDDSSNDEFASFRTRRNFRVSGVLNWYNSNWSSRVCGCQTNESPQAALVQIWATASTGEPQTSSQLYCPCITYYF